MLCLSDVKKSFKEKVVLNGVTFSAGKGEVFGLIGSNGAGKTTIMNIISGLLTYDDGKVEINEKQVFSINDAASEIGYVIDIPAMSEHLTSREYLDFLLSPQNLKQQEKSEKIEKLLEKVGISDAKMQIKHFSRGMKQRLGIAAGLVNNPSVILFDEPCSALDPLGRAEVLNIISELKHEGKTVILSTHILSDIERVCDKVGFLHNGKIVIEGELGEILDKFKENVYRVECKKEDMLKIIDAVKDNENFIDFVVSDDVLNIKFEPSAKKEIFKAITSVDCEIDGINLKTKSIEDIYLSASQGGENNV